MTALPKRTDRIHWSAFDDANKVPLSRQSEAYDRFKTGKDTYDIAKEMGLHESIICRWIDRERNRQRTEKA